MADVKISGLPASTVPLAGTEVLPIVQGGVTKQVVNNDLRPKQIQSNATSGVLQVTGPGAAATRVMTTPDANFTAARIDAAQSFTGDQTISTGNLVQGTAAKGVNFTANTPLAGMTSQLLNWYEEGTWTVTYTSFTFGGTQTQSGVRYVRVGKNVTITGSISDSVSMVSAGGTSYINLPFPPSTNSTCTVVNADSGASLGVGWIRSLNGVMYFPGFSTSGVNQVITWSATYICT